MRFYENEVIKIKFGIGDYGYAENNIGFFNFNKSNVDLSEICILKSKSGDNFSKIVSVFCHEMIHVYDRYFGKMNKHVNDSIMKYGQVHVNKLNNTQYIDGYDVHGRYFENLIEKFNEFGITVKKHYEPNDRKLMKMIDETDDVDKSKKKRRKPSKKLSKKGREIDMSFFNTPILDETEENADPVHEACIEALYDSFKNCYKDLSYIDPDHWYITIA